MTTKRLHELIELAQNGKKFEAKLVDSSWIISDHFLESNVWHKSSVTALWEYREIREPRVVWINEYSHGFGSLNFS